jgi:tripartite-type tricarboxylate transporter receptor subunit TctC
LLYPYRGGLNGKEEQAMNTKRWFWKVVLFSAFLLIATGAYSQSNPTYPSKPISIVATTPAGSPPDLVARIVGERLTSALGQPVVVDNLLGLESVAKSAPDGYTFGIFSTPAAVAPSVMSVPYNATTDFSPVSQITWGTHILVVSSTSSVKSINEVIAFAKSKPGQVRFASGGNFTPAHLAGSFFKLRAGVDIRHMPFQGAVAGVAAVVGGQADFMFAATGAAIPQIKSGKVRAIATTAMNRLPAMPDLPTMSEIGFRDFDVREFTGLVAPAKTPREIIDRIAGEIARIVSSQEVKQRFVSLGMDAATQLGPEAFGALMRSELAKWSKVVREAGIRAD